MADCQVTLQWDPNSEPELGGYRIFMRTENTIYDYENPEWQGTATQCNVPELTGDTTYYFVARAFDTSDNESGDSNEVSYHCTNSNPSSPSIEGNSSGSGGGCFIRYLVNH